MVLTVREDQASMGVTDAARLHYEARLYLLPANAVPPLAPTEVGVIQSYRFSKATAAVPRSPRSVLNMPWVQQFLQDGDNLPEDAELLDMAFLLQTLYRPNGMAVAAPSLLPVPSVRGFLQNDTLIYIRLVSIPQAYQGQRLGRVLFDTYYHCLRRLSECEFVLCN